MPPPGGAPGHPPKVPASGAPERMSAIAYAAMRDIARERGIKPGPLTSERFKEEPVLQLFEKVLRVAPSHIFHTVTSDKDLIALGQKYPDVEEARLRLIGALSRDKMPGETVPEKSASGKREFYERPLTKEEVLAETGGGPKDRVRIGCDYLEGADLGAARRILGDNFEHLHGRKELNRWGQDIRIIAAEILISEGKFDSGRQFLEEALPESANPLFYYYLPTKLANEIDFFFGDFPNAARFPEKSLEKAMEYATSASWKGLAEWIERAHTPRDLETAKVCLIGYLKKHQHDVGAYSLLVNTLLRKGDMDLAIQYLTMKGASPLTALGDCPEELLEALQDEVKGSALPKNKLLATQVAQILRERIE